MTSPIREQIIEAMEDAWARTCHDAGDKAVEAILAAIASLAAIVPREATEEMQRVGLNAFYKSRQHLSHTKSDFRFGLAVACAAMIEVGDMSKAIGE